MSRLNKGGLIDRSKPLRFTFDGKSYQGVEGDTLASALLANRVSLVGRSFKYHRPRGIFSAGSDEPNALVELRKGGRKEPNTRATVVELYDGLAANSQNRWPSCHLTYSPPTVLQRPSSGQASTTKRSCGPRGPGKSSTSPLFVARPAWAGRRWSRIQTHMKSVTLSAISLLSELVQLV